MQNVLLINLLNVVARIAPHSEAVEKSANRNGVNVGLESGCCRAEAAGFAAPSRRCSLARTLCRRGFALWLLAVPLRLRSPEACYVCASPHLRGVTSRKFRDVAVTLRYIRTSSDAQCTALGVAGALRACAKYFLLAARGSAPRNVAHLCYYKPTSVSRRSA